jgi:serine/threonine-protein kinase
MESGQVLQDRYEIEAEVGRGAFGVVYRALDKVTGEPVAIKVLLPWAAQDAELRHRLKREAQLVREIRSPHAVRIDEMADDGQRVFIVMEFLDGYELAQIIARGPLNTDQVDLIARQVLRVLGDAHALGVVHRDIKPHNVFISRGPDSAVLVKVFDFGIAKIVGSESGGLMETTKLTISGGVLGTPAYMSPEQCRGEELTPASDLYSLGIVLYEALTGHVPFDSPNPVQVMIMHLEQPVPPLPPAISDTPLGRAIMRALEKDTARRFSSAAEFLAAIDAPQASSLDFSDTVAKVKHPAAGDSAAAGSPATTPPLAGARAWRPWAWVLTAVAILAVASMIAWLV